MKQKNIKCKMMKKKHKLCFRCVVLFLMATLLVSCKVKEKIDANDKKYIEEGEDLTDILKFVKEVDFDKLDKCIPTEDEIKNDPSRRDLIWPLLVQHTNYIRMPEGYVDDFKLRKFLSVEYIYQSRINGLSIISWDDECRFVEEFLVKRIIKETF